MDDNLRAPDRREEARGDARYLVLALLVGLGAGVVGSLFHLGIDAALGWPDRLRQVLSGPALVLAAAAITMACTVLAVAIVRRFAPEASGSGVQEIEGAMIGLRPLRWRRVLPVKLVAGLLALGSGLVLGREGPTIHMGASVGAALSEWARTSELERRGLLASGAAAGLACAFNAPLGAVLFVIEETRKQFPHTFRTYLGVGVAAVAATAVTQAATGMGADLPLAAGAPPLTLLPAFLFLGVLTGVLGVVLNAGLIRALDLAARTARRSAYLYPAVVGAVVGALVILLPDAATGGESLIRAFASQSPAIGVLVLLATIRFALMVASYSSGAPGGIFAPILSLAVCVGLAFGEAARLLLPEIGIDPLVFAICAMGGLFAASVRAPIVGVALTLELTGSYALVLPVMLTCVTADIVARACGGRAIYSQLLDRTLAAAGAARPPAAAARSAE
jgi:CIC family chloride channel protein